MSTELYRQCLLRCGDASLVSYVPERLSQVGTVVEVQGASRQPWVVFQRYFSVVEERPSAMKDIRHHRRATGDALPKEQQ